jgi:hypothetical protein
MPPPLAAPESLSVALLRWAGQALAPSVVESLTPLLDALGDRIVSALSDAIAAASKSADDAIARVQSDVAALDATIEALQAKIDQGTATPEDIAAVQALQAKLDALDPTSPEVLPEPVP